MKRIANTKLALGAVSGVAALATYVFLIRPWHLRWGATDEEVNMTLPGDEFVENPKLNATHAITIHASAADVWPWLIQLGQKRGGFYSTWLENLVGCNMQNANRIVPDWQDLRVGDEVWLHPKAPPLRVLAIEPRRAIVLEKCWTFILCPIDEHTTRLIIRGRGEFNPDLKNRMLNFLLWRGIFEPAHFIMERKMLLGVKQRAEAKAEMQRDLRSKLHAA
jgi:hypothetical protein